MAEFIANYLDSLRRQESASEMISSTSRHVWDALAAADIDPWMTPDASLDRSVPDYHEDRMSHDDDYYSSQIGRDWWEEKQANDRSTLGHQNLEIVTECEAFERERAETACKGNDRLQGPQGPQGPLPESVGFYDCVAMWADGINSARSGETRPGADRASGEQIGGNFGWSAGDEGGVEASINAGYSNQTTRHDPTTSREEDLPGIEGYHRKCARLANTWMDEQVAARVLRHYAQ